MDTLITTKGTVTLQYHYSCVSQTLVTATKRTVKRYHHHNVVPGHCYYQKNSQAAVLSQLWCTDIVHIAVKRTVTLQYHRGSCHWCYHTSSLLFTYLLISGVVGAPQMTSQPVSSIYSLFSIALWDLANSGPVHSLMLSSHLCFCLPCLLPPFTVPCRMVLARPDERETCPYHCSLCLFMMVRRSACDRIAGWILV